MAPIVPAKCFKNEARKLRGRKGTGKVFAVLTTIPCLYPLFYRSPKFTNGPKKEIRGEPDEKLGTGSKE